ncbi:hypothetical protein QBC38DRAFT_465790 [Podospora fimiseda]|uniref:Uncharacterized protein n=1 Tax=Podospora fimiseda TaxID=252190 RepID=A0AAN7BXI6_9PEZI|nr:hypothetical protein QBC38DRAFT_465790 [Podospora fimiseda]
MLSRHTPSSLQNTSPRPHDITHTLQTTNPLCILSPASKQSTYPTNIKNINRKESNLHPVYSLFPSQTPISPGHAKKEARFKKKNTVKTAYPTCVKDKQPSQFGPNTLQPILHILQSLRSRLPIIKLPHKLSSLIAQLSLYKILLQHPPHNPRQMIRVRIRQRSRSTPMMHFAFHFQRRTDIRCFKRVHNRQVINLFVII